MVALETPRGAAGSGWRPWAGRRLAVGILLVGLFGLDFWLWSRLIAHNVPRAAAVLEATPSQAERNRVVLSSDLLEYRDYFRDFPVRYEELTLQRSFVEFYKRPLYGPVSATLNVVASRGFGIAFPERMYLILALYATGATALMVLLAVRAGLRLSEAVLLGVLCNLSFGWAAIFSIVESYSLSVCGVLLALLSGQTLGRLRGRWVPAGIGAHALVSGLAAWLYLPALGAVLLVVGRVERGQQWLTRLLPAAILAASVAILPHIYWDTVPLEAQVEYGHRLASLGHLVEPRTVGHVGAALLYMSLLSPVDDFVTAAPDVAPLVAMPSGWTLLAVTGLSLLYFALGRRALAGGRIVELRGPLAWLAALFLFHVLFNPGEILLYLSVPTAVIFYIAAVAIGPAGPRARWPVIVTLAGLCAVTALHNLTAIVGGGR